MMRAFVLVLLVLPLLHAASLDMEQTLEKEWNEWKQVFKKAYYDIEDELTRKAVWRQNLRTINKHNLEHDLGKHTYRLEMNHFGDLNASEYKSRMNGFRNDMRLKRQATVISSIYLPPLNVDPEHLPKHVDWRQHGYVTAVKDQGQCGSCWSFSATGSLEGQHFRKTGNLVSLSEQNLMDCSRKEGNMGCEGGLMDQAFDYIKLQKGIDDEKDYPYEARDANCRYQEKYNSANDTGYVDIPKGNEKALKKAIAHVGPISVAIDASHQSFQFYSKGVYNEPQCSSQELDHGVLAVGYGTDETGGDYWIVKNSWAKTWGDEGYIWMSRGKDNQCGIATSASYPVV